MFVRLYADKNVSEVNLDVYDRADFYAKDEVKSRGCQAI